MGNSMDRRSFPHSRSRPSRQPRRSRGVGIGLLTIAGALVLGDEALGQVGVESDREVLEAFYHATGGPDWFFSTNWLSDEPLSEWYGVYTNEQGRVDRLFLRSNNLSGALPPELARLTRLRNLSLRFNQLSGPIPPELGQLTGLLGLNLHRNQLTGPIPPELGQLNNLDLLHLDENQLTGPIPPELGRLTALTTILGLSDNQLTGPIPPELGRLTNLESLQLHRTQLAGPIPPELGQLTNLTYLNLLSNQLSGPIPPELGELTRLTSLQLRRQPVDRADPPRAGPIDSTCVYPESVGQPVDRTDPPRAGAVDQPRETADPRQPADRAASGRVRKPHGAYLPENRRRHRALSAAGDPGHGVRTTGAPRGCSPVCRGDGTPAGDVVGAGARPRRARVAPAWNGTAVGCLMAEAPAAASWASSTPAGKRGAVRRGRGRRG